MFFYNNQNMINIYEWYDLIDYLYMSPEVKNRISYILNEFL